MSGGVGPSDDILSKHETNRSSPAKTHLRRGILTFQQLNALALTVVLSASGMVAVEDLAFIILSFFYMYFLSRVAFPTLHPSDNQLPFPENNRLLTLYRFAGAVVGLFLPVAYIFEGIYEASQLFLEGVAVSDHRFSVPMRVLVPAVYNSTRMFSLMEWVNSEVWKVEHEFQGSGRRLVMGRVLAVANLVYWGFNLFGFLLPVYLPRAFKRYYSDGKKIKDKD